MKKLIALSLAVVMSIGLAACSSGGQTSSGSDGGNAQTDGKTVVYWSMWEATEPQGQAIQQSVEAFEAETGINVDLQFKGRTGIREGLQPALDAGQVVDVFDESTDRINTIFLPYVMDLEELAAKYNYEETAEPSLMSLCRELAGGKLMSIPYQPSLWAFFYNQDILDEAGVTELPTTWDEFLEMCEKIKQAGYAPITCDDAYSTAMFGHHLSRLVGEDRVVEIVTNGEWDDPAVLQFAKDYEELASKGYFVDTIASNVWPSGQIADIGSGNAAMYLNGSWLPNEIKDTTGPDFRWGCFAYPELEGGEYGLEAGSYGAQCFAINKESQVSDEAFQLINYLTKGEADQLLSELSVGIPADTTNTEWPEMLECVKPVMSSFTVRWSTYCGANSNSDITPALKENVLKLCGGMISADEFVANMMAASGK